MLRLITIAISHYNEKARWALERYGVAYREQPYMPALHRPAVMWATRRRSNRRDDEVSSRFSTPVLVLESGESICDSSDIVHHVAENYTEDGEQTLYPDPEIAELERLYNDRLGPHTRRVFFWYTLFDNRIGRLLAENNVSAWQARAYRFFQPGIRRILTRLFQLQQAPVEHSIEQIKQIVAKVSERVRGRPYLVGERFTAADLAFACMLAPVIWPSREDGYGAFLPSIDDAPAEAATLINEIRDTQAGQFALRMFRDERGPITAMGRES